MLDYTVDELMVVCMSRQVKDGELVAQGLATPLVAAAYLLARMTHAPNLYIVSAIGQGICHQPAPLGLTNVEKLWIDNAITSVGFVRAFADMLPSLRPKEFFRPAQIDPNGNFNNIAYGKDYGRPRLRLPGSAGIPDMTIFSHEVYLYVPRHSRITFVPKLDFVSGLGHVADRKTGSGPRYLVSDLGQFDFVIQNKKDSANLPQMRVTSIHPGVTIEHLQAKTGFQLLIAPDLGVTPSPSPEELQLLRESIDPIGIRRLELISGAERRALIHEIIRREARQ